MFDFNCYHLLIHFYFYNCRIFDTDTQFKISVDLSGPVTFETMLNITIGMTDKEDKLLMKRFAVWFDNLTWNLL